MKMFLFWLWMQSINWKIKVELGKQLRRSVENASGNDTGPIVSSLHLVLLLDCS